MQSLAKRFRRNAADVSRVRVIQPTVPSSRFVRTVSMTVPSSRRCNGPAEEIGPVDAGRVAVGVAVAFVGVVGAPASDIGGVAAVTPVGGAYFVVARMTASAT